MPPCDCWSGLESATWREIAMLKFSGFESIIIDWRTGSQTNDRDDGREKKAFFELCGISFVNFLSTLIYRKLFM